MVFIIKRFRTSYLEILRAVLGVSELLIGVCDISLTDIDTMVDIMVAEDCHKENRV